MEGLGNLATDALDAADCFYIEFLWRELDGGITTMNPSKLDVFTDGVSKYLTILGHGIHLNLLGMLNELGDNNGVVFAHISGQLEKAFQLVTVGADVHGSTAEHIAGTHKDGESDALHETVYVSHACKCAPLWLIDAKVGEQLRELGTVFGTVNVLCLCAKDTDTSLVEVDGEVVGNLSACRDYDTMGLFQVNDVKHAFEGQLVEIETVAHVVVGADSLGVVVYHHAAPAFFANSIESLHTAPVELHTGADAVGART